MKIGIITNLYPPYVRGGAEHVVVRTVEALTELYPEHEVFVISTHPRKKGVDPIRDSISTERVYRFFPRNLYYVLDDHKWPWPLRIIWHFIDAYCFCGARRVGEVLDKEKPDVVITHNLKGIGLRIPRAIQKRKIPHVHIMHDLQLLFPSGLKFFGHERDSWYASLCYLEYRRVCRMRLGKPDLIVFPSKYLHDEYSKFGFGKSAKMIVMPNPAPQMKTVQRSNRSDGDLRLLFVGQLEQHKGVKFLLQTLKDIPGDVHLIFAGEGTCAGRVEKAAAKNKHISYLGYISMDHLVNCLGMADALVVPSLCYENSPTVIYEALQAGVPVIASDIGGVGELVEDGKNGFLFTPGDSKDFLRAIECLNARRDEFFDAQDKIKETVAPYALASYTKALVEKLVDIVQNK
ncbi:MAG: glycosyltransferase [Candidatus Uhrbacteria bacterium]|nr:glycosyltransferase [Candidatus Uhrbacteria bacterium]